ncbi:MAG: AraC family transcriptional regulator [Xanthomonadales bacterium]|nr:AraC family transcriptional regulator [Xanthomonadales bacterium]
MADRPHVLIGTPELDAVMDALADVLRATRLNGGAYLRGEFREPWCIAGGTGLPDGVAPYLTDTTEIVPYHFVLDGLLRVKTDGAPPLEIQSGEAVLFPHNSAHVLGGDLALPPTPSADLITQSGDDVPMFVMNLDGSGHCTRIGCGYLAGERLRFNPLFRALPPVLPFKVRESRAADWVRSTFQYAADQIADGRIGSDTVLAKVSELLLVEAVRSYVDALPDGQSGWLAGLRDAYVARALRAMHSDLGARWTVEKMGREAGLSRSAFAQRFTGLMDMTPMQYLAHWRMEVAAQQLCATDRSILAIAQDVGYDTEAAFSRAFKRHLGKPPATWRRNRARMGSE